MYKKVLPFFKITNHKKKNKCMHNRLVPQPTKLFAVYFKSKITTACDI